MRLRGGWTAAFAPAFHQRNFLRLAGYEIVDKSDGVAGECWLPLKSELEELAVVGDKKRKVKPNMLLKSGERYVHAALRKFDDLPQVDKLFKSVNVTNNEEPDVLLQDKESDLIYGFNSLRKAGLSIRRVG